MGIAGRNKTSHRQRYSDFAGFGKMTPICYHSHMKFQKSNPKNKMFNKPKKEKILAGAIKSPLNKDLQKMVGEHWKNAEKGMNQYLKWAFEEVIPRYDRYLLNQKKKGKEYKDMLGIAEVFLDICGGLGFLEFDNLHPGFVESFPDLFK